MSTITDAPEVSLDVSEPTIGQLPEAEASPADKTVAVHLIQAADMGHSTFWVGLFQKGTVQPPELLDSDSFDEIFQTAATQGLKEAGPVMLSDSSSQPARYIYLLPEPGHNSKDQDKLTEELVKTVEAWAPQKLGIYLAPELLTRQATHTLLYKVVKGLIESTETSDFYLMPGSHGVNTVLNIALDIKDACEDDERDIYVFH